VVCVCQLRLVDALQMCLVIGVGQSFAFMLSPKIQGRGAYWSPHQDAQRYLMWTVRCFCFWEGGGRGEAQPWWVVVLVPRAMRDRTGQQWGHWRQRSLVELARSP
jgi:hypothetical protein